ncbi:anti-sigma factor domain-containing protein [Curtobacterium sp. VKM Ac-1376]|uniref:anti-sigma factor n=1 Tax=Curtobacterium sp. VKM Ac-1376 TaxID=123312 RepID=UPI00188CE96E|nr:anti-sigma factor [Curtobacterium sp. VKM Ac-1376]MBF4615626.1 anti-sigma factor [Curtobacterium sp. VKM Ac-1376]
MTERHDDPALLTGSHALDALSGDERALLEDALRTSPELQAENDSLRETALQLAYAVEPIEPPASLKASLLAQIATTPQAAPLAGSMVDETAVTRTTPAQEARPASAAPVASIADRPTAGGRASAEARRRWFQRPAALLSAAAVAVVFLGVGLGVGTILDPSDGSGPGTTQASSGLDRIYAASDFQRSTTEVEGGGTATVVWSDDLGKSAVILDGVEQPPKGKTYELWYIGSEEQGGAIESAGLVDGATDGVHAAVLEGAMSQGATIGMTVEPEGGSEQPTTAPIMAVPTTSA